MKKSLISFLLLAVVTLILCGTKKSNENTMIEISTDYGKIILKLYDDTPLHRDNYIKLIKEGWFENSSFYRIVPDFVIQGGGNADTNKVLEYTIPAEIMPQHFHKRGVLGAVRPSDQFNPERRSAACHFYIVQGRTYTDSTITVAEARADYKIPEKHKKIYKTKGGAAHLDNLYTVFGEVLEGMDVVDQIVAVRKTGKTKPEEEMPVKDVNMSIQIIDKNNER